MKLVAGFNADNVVDVNTDVTPPPNFGGHTMAVAAAPVNGTNPRLMLAATLSGGLWQTTVDATGQSVGRWSHVDSFLPKRLWDVKILANEPNVAIVTATGDTQNGFVTGGVWRGVYSGGSWTWTQATNATASYRMDVVPGPVGASRIYVASYCGLLVSTNSGVGFTGYSPDGNGCNVPHSGQFFDVKVEAIPATSGAPAHDLASVCGVPGFARWSSNTGSGTPGWGVINPNSPIQSGAPLGNGDPRSVNMPCSIALAPFDDNTVFVATQSTQPNGSGGGILFESDTASRANPPAPGFCDPTTCFPQWFNLQPTSDDNGQAAWVVAHPETNPIDPQNFLVYFGTSKRTLVEQCNTQVIFADGMHCSAGSNNWTNFDQNALHSDPSRIFFDDPGDTTYNGCPWIETGDGGIFRDTTVYSSTSNCEDGPAWTDVDSGLRALQSYSLAGSISTSGGTTHTDLYTGRQDNGLLLSLNSGGQWSQSPDTRGGGDEIQILPPYHTTAGVPPGTLYNAGQPFVVKVANEDFSSTTPLNTSPPAPPGYQPATYWNIAQLPPGGGDFLAITPNAAPPGQVWTAYFATLCGFAPGFTCTQWTAAGSNATLPGSPIVAQNPAGIPVYSQVQAAAGFPAGCTSPCHTVDAFYVILKVGSSNHLYRLGNWDLTLTPAQNNPTWTDITGSLKNPGLFAVNPFDPNRLYVLDSGDSMGNHVGFYKTTNGWAAPPAGTTSVDPGWNVDANLNAAIQKFNPVTAQNTYNIASDLIPPRTVG